MKRRRQTKAGRNEPLCRIARSPLLRTGPQQQVAADDGLFPACGRSRTRLCARRAHRLAVLPICQSRAHSHLDRRARRSGAVRAVLRLCRRPVGNGRAAVADASRAKAKLYPVPVGGGDDALDARQIAIAGAARALARCARRNRTLGLAQARHRRPSHRRLGAAGQDRGRRAGRQRRHRYRTPVGGLNAALCRAFRLARRPRRAAGDPRPSALPPGDAGARGRGHRLCGTRRCGFHGGMEMGRHPHPSRRRHGRRRRARDTALFAHRRRHHQKLPRPCGRIPARRRHRWRTPDPARRARAILQCPAAAAKPQNRHAEAACRIPCASARLRSSRRWHGGLARSSVCRAAQMPGSVRDQARRSARRSLAHDRIQVLGRIESRAYRSVLRRRRRRCRRRRHAQAARFDLRARPPARAVVEMEARSVHGGCRSDVCAARARQALVLLFRLHFRRLEGGRRRRGAGAGRQGLFRLHRRGIAENRPLRPEKHRRPFRPGAGSHPRARRRPGVRSRLRGSGALNEA